MYREPEVEVPGEVWKRLEDPFQLYEVSDQGRVRWRHNLKPVNRLIMPNLHVRCSLQSIYGDHKGFLVHRLVAIAFLPNPTGLPEVNHKNYRPRDNRLINLEWISRLENVRHRRGAFLTREQRWDSMQGPFGPPVA